MAGKKSWVHEAPVQWQIANWQPANYHHPSIRMQGTSGSERKAPTWSPLFLPTVSFPSLASCNATPMCHRKAAHSKWNAVHLHPRRLRSSAVPHLLCAIEYIKPTEAGGCYLHSCVPVPKRLDQILTGLPAILEPCHEYLCVRRFHASVAVIHYHPWS